MVHPFFLKRIVLLSVIFLSVLFFFLFPLVNQNPSLLFFIPYSCEYDTCSTIIIRGDSMLPTFESGEKAVILSDYYTRFPIERGDVVGVFFKQTLSGPKQYVKRIVAVSGDAVSLDDQNRILVNGKLLDGGFGFAYSNPEKDLVFIHFLNKYRGKVPEGYLVVLGDNRSDSFDSRRFGFIPISLIVGKVEKSKG